MVNIPTNYKMGSGLAATIMGQQAGLEAEQQGLENLYKAGQVPTQMLEGAKAMDLLNNPEYMKATQQWQTTAAQGRVSEEQSKKAYNDLTLLTTQLQAYNGDINKQRSILMESFQKNGVPIDSPMAQTLLQKPLENTMVARDQVASTLSKTPEHMGQVNLKNVEGEWGMKKQESANAAHLASARITAGASRYSADAMAANKDTQSLINTENNLRQRVAQYDTTIERYARGDADAEIIANIRKADPKKSEKQAKSEAKLQREETVKTLRAERDGLVKRADEIGDAVTGRLKLGQKAPTNTGGSAPPPPSGYKPI